MRFYCALILVLTCAESFGADATGFKFNPGDRRDPFTFARRPDIRNVVKEPERIDFSRNIRDAQQWLSDAEVAALERRSSACVQKCDLALNSLKDAPKDAGVEPLRQSLSRLRRAAESMLRRDEALAAFQKLNVTVTGVVARPRKAQAIVNGMVVREGQSLAAAENESLIVEKISSDQVVLNFRGYRVAAPLTLTE